MTLGRAVVLINEGAGSINGSNTEGEIERIEGAFASAAPEVDVRVEAVDPADMQDRIREIWANDPPDAIVIGGGDGTVNNAANAAAGTDVVLGVLPLGTFNHFAGELGIPDDLSEAVGGVAAGEVRQVDVGEVNGRVFVNNSLLGAYPHMVATRDEIMDRHGWGKVRAVPAAVMHTLRDFPTHRIDLRGDRGFSRSRLRTPFVFVGNGVYTSEDGGTPRRDRLDGGALGLEVARGESRLRLVVTAIVAVLRGAGELRDFDRQQLSDLTISTAATRLQVALDGEVALFDTPLSFRIRPAALRVIAPT